MKKDELARRLSSLNILGVYYNAPEDTKEQGRIWYNVAYNTMQAIAQKTSLPIATVISAASALSPNNNWRKNVSDIDRLAMAFVSGAEIDSIKVSTYNPNKRKAWLLLQHWLTDNTDRQRETLNGLKTTAFYDCIRYAGQPEYEQGRTAVCVDGHAKNIFYGERHGLSSNKSNIGKKEYHTIAEAYCTAALMINETTPAERPLSGCQVQAITWGHWRNLHGIK